MDQNNTSTAVANSKLYSPSQVAAGVFIGGPIAVVYFLLSNSFTTRNDKLINYGIALSFVFVILMSVSVVLLPVSFPRYGINAILTVAAFNLADRIEVSNPPKHDAVRFDRHSHGKTALSAVVCLLGSLLLAIVSLHIYRSF